MSVCINNVNLLIVVDAFLQGFLSRIIHRGG